MCVIVNRTLSVVDLDTADGAPRIWHFGSAAPAFRSYGDFAKHY